MISGTQPAGVKRRGTGGWGRGNLRNNEGRTGGKLGMFVKKKVCFKIKLATVLHTCEIMAKQCLSHAKGNDSHLSCAATVLGVLVL